MFTVLSTKILTPPQKQLLLNSGLGLVEYDAIDIQFRDFEITDEFDHLIFTSKNAVKSYTKRISSEKHSKIKAFCVGDKTHDLLNSTGFTVMEKEKNALELGKIIALNYKNDAFLFLSGNKRRNELPSILEKNNIRYKELVVYDTFLKPEKFERTFDGLLFFSPSGVTSFVQKNNLVETTCFCIGETTAQEAKKYTDKIIIAKKPTVENVLVQAIKELSFRLPNRLSGGDAESV